MSSHRTAGCGWRDGGRRIRLALPALLALILAAPLTAAGAVAAPAERPDGRPSVGPAADPLPKPARGAGALTRLGDRLPEVARLNGLSRSALASLLREDASAWVAGDGRVFFQDPGPTAAEAAQLAESSALATATAPLAETFALHSRPGASRTVFLDVDGGTVSGTEWNSTDGVGTSHPAWDPSHDGPSFDDAELAKVQAVWAMVAEDFAAFDVDVTTEDPGPAGLSRADAADTTYGARALITPSDDAWNRICGRACGGVAYLSVFGEVDGGTPSYQPAWVFTDGLGNSVKGVAEAASHEVGHQLGLRHDGKDGSSYYGGHGVWGPIMGATYNRPVSQWSRGDYAGATNTQDDLAVIGSRIAPLADEAGEAVAGAAALPTGTASITSRTDVDTYALGVCTGQVIASATTVDLGPDLDVGLSLLDADGAVVASADPAAARVSSSRASGVDAALDVSVPAGAYHLRVDGVGNGTPDADYDDYGSIGSYALEVTGCDGEAPAGAPSLPQDVTATPDPAEPSVALTWSAPADAGSGAVTGYTVTTGGSDPPVTLPAGARSHTVTGLEPATAYTFTVSAQNDAGSGPSATVTATTAAEPVTAPSAPRSFAATWRAEDETVRLTWAEPADDGGGPVEEYRFYADDSLIGILAGDARSATGSGFDPGTHTLGIRAVNSAGEGAAATTSLTVPQPPPEPAATETTLTGTRTGRGVDLDVDVTGAGGTPDGTVAVHHGNTVVETATLVDGHLHASLDGLAGGDHTFTASYAPASADWAASTSTAWQTSVPAEATTTSLEATVIDRSVRLVATARSDWGSPDGRIEIRSGGRVVADLPTQRVSSETGARVTGGVTVGPLPPGAHSWTARLVPDDPATYAGSTSAPAQASIEPLATTTWTGRSVSDQTVRLVAIVVLPDGDVDAAGPPTGTITFREEGSELGSAALERLADDRAIARLELTDVAPGEHTYRGDYSPADATRLAPSGDAAKAVTVDRIASTTRVRAPWRSRAWRRPVIRVDVAGGAEQARGRVRVVVRALRGRTPHRAATLWLRNGRAYYRLPWLRPGRVRVAAAYRGNPVHQPSWHARTIRVTRP